MNMVVINIVVIKYFYYVLYFSRFTGIFGFVIGLINGYNQAKNNITNCSNDFVSTYDVINEYAERLVKKTVFFSMISFTVGILAGIFFPGFIFYFTYLFVSNKISNLIKIKYY